MSKLKKIPLIPTTTTQVVHIPVHCTKGLATIELKPCGPPDNHGGKSYECTVRFHPFRNSARTWYKIIFDGLLSFKDKDPGFVLPVSIWQLTTISHQQIIAAAIVGSDAVLKITEKEAIITCPVIKNGSVRAEVPKALKKILFG